MTTPDLTDANEIADYLAGSMGRWHSGAPAMLRALAAELERLRAQVAPAEPFWYAVISERAPVINATYRRQDVALERLARIQDERSDITDAEVVPLYRLPPAQQAEPVAVVSGMDEYGPLLEWRKHWTTLPIGAKLYGRPEVAHLGRQEPAQGAGDRDVRGDGILGAADPAAPVVAPHPPAQGVGDERATFANWYWEGRECAQKDAFLQGGLLSNLNAWAAWQARAALAQAPAAEPQRQRVGLTDERILHLHDTHVGEPSPGYPLKNSDWINFARAVIAADRAAQAPAAEPLTVEQLDRLSGLAECWSGPGLGARFLAEPFARAIERAHGIGAALVQAPAAGSAA